MLQVIIVNSQDFTNIKEQKAIKITGGFGAKASHFGAINEELKRDPFFYSLNANMNINIYGVLSVPLSFIYTRQDSKFNYPEYKQFGISPKYKGYTLHLGYRNIQFSQYTLSGLTFLGVGAEIKPKDSWFEISALYGQFQKPIEYVDVSAFDADRSIIQESAAYDRRGYGGKFTIKKFNQTVDLILFKAKDFVNSIDTIPASLGIKPAENLVLGINTQNKISDKISLKIEYAVSAYTTDIRMDDVELTTYTYANNFKPFFSPKVSSELNSMFNSNISLQTNIATVGLNYKRIDPDYKTMGSTYLNNDVEEYTFNTSFNIFKNKVSLTGNIGMQHNNLDNKQATTMTRVIGSANASWAITSKINASINYSNFSSNTLPTRVNLLDSIKYLQVTENMGFNTSINFGSEKQKQSINFLANYQTASTQNKAYLEEQNSINNVMNSNVSYSNTITKFDMNINIGVNYSNFISSQAENISVGPSFGINKSIFQKKMRIGLNAIYLESYLNNQKQSTIINYSINSSFKINKHQSVSLTGRLLDRNIILQNIKSQQYQISINYKYRF